MCDVSGETMLEPQNINFSEEICRYILYFSKHILAFKDVLHSSTHN